MWLDLATAVSCGGAGVTCGWVMHALGGSGNHKLLRRAASSIANYTATDECKKECLVQIAHRLKASASNISSAVEGYQTKVLELSDQLSERNDGSHDRVAAVISQLIETNQQIQERLQQVRTQVNQQAGQVNPAAPRPPAKPLTRITERDIFDQHLAKRFELGPRSAGSLAFLEIDEFKTLNDTYGDQTGEDAIKVIANLLHARIGSLGLVAYYTNQQFAVILDDCRLEEAAQRLETVRFSLGERNMQLADKSLWMSVSLGVTELLPKESIEQWQQRTNEALNRSKAAGGDCGYEIRGNDFLRIRRNAEPREKIETSVDQDPPVGQLIEAEVDELEIIDVIESPTTVPAKPSQDTAGLRDDDDCLPDTEMLTAEFESIRDRMHAKTPIFVSAICFKDSPDSTQRRLMTRILRAEMRCIDRLGNHGDSIFLLCMPSVSPEAAQDRAKRILRSARDPFRTPKAKHSLEITIGVTPSNSHEEFCEVVDRAIGLAEQADEHKNSCIFGDAEQPVA
ncbi:MAG: diguanylate cyclase [Rubripirellula sp.]|nr:diguanylate cyclase [Rubripirellula sp.]